MLYALKPHLDSLARSVAHIEVELARPADASLTLTYRVTGDLGELRLPPSAVAARAHALWEHTCFEAFVRGAEGSGYYEFNFSPSTQWAAYWLSDYRSGMEAADEIGDPSIAVQTAAGCYTLHARLNLDQLARLPGRGRRLGLSALIEDAHGRKSYWALNHPPGKPDFHHSGCFALELP